MSNLTDFMGGGSIKSVQRGRAACGAACPGTATITISAVNPDKSFLLVRFNFQDVILYQRVTLVSSTEIEVDAGNNTYDISWQVVEFN